VNAAGKSPYDVVIQRRKYQGGYASIINDEGRSIFDAKVSVEYTAGDVTING
jgi:anti-sigma regulatory factor (Ser/Thr protein kinase)